MSGGLFHLFRPCRPRLWQALGEDVGGCRSLHIMALVVPFVVVADEMGIEVL